MGLTSEEFWKLTLVQFNAMCKRFQSREERMDFHAGLICSVLANINRDPKRKTDPYTAKDFMPGQPVGRKDWAAQKAALHGIAKAGEFNDK